MNKREFSIIASTLRSCYSQDRILLTEEALEVWFRQLEDIPYNVALKVIDDWIKTEEHAPKICNIRAKASEVTSGAIPDYGEAWEMVRRAVSLYGVYDPEKAYAFLGETISRCVKKLGWNDICMSEEGDRTIRANFRMIYEAESNRVTQEKSIARGITSNPLKGIEEAI